MKLRILVMGVFLSIGFGGSAFAGADHPCKAIRSACEAAGFVKGKDVPAGKHLFHDCIRPLMKGESVSGVSVSADELKACKERREARREKFREQHEQNSSSK